MRARLAAALLAAGCASPSAIPPAETPFAAAKRAQAASFVAVAPAATSRAAADVPVPTPSPRDPRADWADLTSPDVAAFAARLADPQEADAALATTPLGPEHVALAVWERHPGVAAARAEVEAARRAFTQAAWLDDVATRYRSLAAPGANAAAAMGEEGVRPDLGGVGLGALRAAMLDAEVAVARERLRMTYRDAYVEALRAFHDAAHHREEVRIRRDQQAVAERLVAAARSQVSSGRAAQAELLEAESELAMARNDVAHAESALQRWTRTLASLLGRDLDAPLVLDAEMDVPPPGAVPDAAELAALAKRASPEVRMARAEARRIGAAARMVVRDATMDPTRVAPESTAPFAAEVAARREAAERAVADAERAAERRVLGAVYELANAARMFDVAARTAEPLARRALDERLRLYEGGRGEFAEVLGAARRHLAAQHDAAQARHDHGVMEAMLWMAVGTRPAAAGHAHEEDGR